MKVLWILTIGSSDVQFESEAITKDKQKSLELPNREITPIVWREWYTDQFKNRLRPAHDFRPTQASSRPNKNVPYRISARVLGMLYQYYQEQDQDIQDEIWSYLTFPLLDGFVKKLNIEGGQKPNAIALILTDQSTIFKTKGNPDEYSPYWQDTCCLEPILERYFQGQYPDAEIIKFRKNPESDLQSIILKPDGITQGLDDWDSVLKLVRDELKQLPNNTDQDSSEPELVYVSHQAGTPAISSAVQFSSLAMYGDRVRFLVSSERDPENTQMIESSSYLRGLQREQAKKQLEHYDYIGVNELVADYLDDDAKILIKAAIQWNFAHFMQGSNLNKKGKKSKEKSFLEELKNHPNFSELVGKRTKEENWWWEAYEAAYLGVIRLRQGNTVEAVFHSFRAVEGLLKRWVEEEYLEEIKNTKHPDRDKNLRRYGNDLYIFLSMKKKIDQTENFDIWVFGNKVFEKRNELFHDIKGLNHQKDVFETWRSPQERQWEQPETQWKDRIKNCLNFIADKDFSSLEEASLMAEVHKELKQAIINL